MSKVMFKTAVRNRRILTAVLKLTFKIYIDIIVL